MDILQNANEAQRQAITSEHQPVVIVAGPGTGKTKTLTARIAYLLSQGIIADSIIALTFTNKAAQEMRERVRTLVGKERLPTIATFHALCLSILRDAQPDRKLLFASEVERTAAVRKARVSFGRKDLSTRDASLAISRYKGSLEPDKTLGALVNAYNQELQRQGVIDFDDVLLETYRLLEHDTGLRARFQHVLIDEFQDTSELQWRLVQLLRGSESVFVIGDPKQSIYGFRGATRDMFAVFKADFPHAQTITLAINYRSSPDIVAVGNAVFPDAASLSAHQTVPGAVGTFQTLNEYSEADAVLAAIEQGVGGTTMLNATNDVGTHGFRDFAILYRTHRTAAIVQQRLYDSGVPYQVVGEGSPYERPEIQAIIESLRWLSGREHQPNVKGFTPGQVGALLETIDNSLPVSALAQSVIKRLALGDGGAKVQQNMSQFIGTLVRFDARSNSLDELVAYLDDISQHEFYDSAADVVTLMTIHASKGLEFNHIILLAAEEDILPHVRKGQPANIDEERRLFYVAVTRAKKHLSIMHSKKRVGQKAVVSRFVSDISNEILPRVIDPAMDKIEKRIERRAQKSRQATLF